MNITLGTIFSTVNAAKAVAEYTGLIDSLGIKLDRLASAKLYTAVRELNHARNSSSLEEQRSALRQARAYLSEALSLERAEEKLALAYVGLGMVFSQLEDKKNCENTLVEFSNQPFRKQSVQALQTRVCREILNRNPGNPHIPDQRASRRSDISVVVRELENGSIEVVSSSGGSTRSYSSDYSEADTDA